MKISDKDERSWWRECTDAVFQERLSDMGTNALQELSADISAALVSISSQRQAGSPDADWLQRVRYAEGKVSARRHMLRAELSARNETARTANFARKRAHVARLRAILDSGDVAACVRMMIDDMDPDRRERP